MRLTNPITGREFRWPVLALALLLASCAPVLNAPGPAPPPPAIDGDALVTKLMNLGLGVKKTTIECVEVDPTWFESL